MRLLYYNHNYHESEEQSEGNGEEGHHSPWCLLCFLKLQSANIKIKFFYLTHHRTNQSIQMTSSSSSFRLITSGWDDLTVALEAPLPGGRRCWVFLGFGFSFKPLFFFKSFGNVLLKDFNLAIASWAGDNLMAAAVLVFGTWRSFLADATADALTLGNLVTVELLLEAA